MFIKNAKLYKNVLVTNLYLHIIMIEISSIYSFWWLLPIFIVSFALAALLYFRNAKEEFPKWSLLLLALFRFVVLSTLGFLLLSPLVMSWQTDVEKAKVIVVVDDSKSMILYGDSNELRNYNNNIIDNINARLSDKFEVVNYSFGNQLIHNSGDNKFGRLRTDLNNVFITISQKYKYNNIGAVILASDGIYNVGNNPIYTSKYSKFPIYTLGFGDTVMHHDLAIDKVIVNKTAFVKNKIPIEVSISAKMLDAAKSKLIISSGGNIIHKKEIRFSGDSDFQKHLFYIEEKTAGLKTYRIHIQQLDNERNIINNTALINVDVLGSKKKVLLLFSSPHPDIAALQNAINRSEEYELEVVDYRKFRKNIADYSVVILHQTPNNSIQSASIINKMRDKGIPSLSIIGANSGVHYFNALNMGVNIDFKKQSFIETTSKVNSEFSEFLISDGFVHQISLFPPLYSPYGQYKTSNSVRSILYQQIGSVATKYPQVSVSENSGKRNAFIFGEGIWRWRMYDYAENSSFDIFDGFILKLIRYIAIDKHNKRFDMQWENKYLEFDDIAFNAQFYNASYEPVSDAAINLIIENSDGKKYNYSFVNSNSKYSLSAGRLAAGKYSFVAKVDYNGKKFSEKGSFIVEAVQLEASNLLANHVLLRKISFNSDADYYKSSDYELLINELLNRKDIVDVQTQRIEYSDLINFPLVLLLIILLLSAEWFMRKQMGSY